MPVPALEVLALDHPALPLQPHGADLLVALCRMAHQDDLAASLAERFPKAAALMHEAKEDVLAFRHFSKDHWKKVWSTNLLERVNEEI